MGRSWKNTTVMKRMNMGNLVENVQSAKLGGVLSVKSVNVVTKYRNQTQRIIGLITTCTVNELENV